VTSRPQLSSENAKTPMLMAATRNVARGMDMARWD
jgi:hypothetical protein